MVHGAQGGRETVALASAAIDPTDPPDGQPTEACPVAAVRAMVCPLTGDRGPRLRCFSYVDILQPQTAGFLGTVSQGYHPLVGMRALIEVAPGMDINLVTDIALSTPITPGMRSSSVDMDARAAPSRSGSGPRCGRRNCCTRAQGRRPLVRAS